MESEETTMVKTEVVSFRDSFELTEEEAHFLETHFDPDGQFGYGSRLNSVIYLSVEKLDEGIAGDFFDEAGKTLLESIKKKLIEKEGNDFDGDILIGTYL